MALQNLFILGEIHKETIRILRIECKQKKTIQEFKINLFILIQILKIAERLKQ